jgi:hypothetical protein
MIDLLDVTVYVQNSAVKTHGNSGLVGQVQKNA